MDTCFIIEDPNLEGCLDHPDEKLTHYCNDHKTKCCERCYEQNHRECKKMDTSSESIKDHDNRKEFEDFKYDMDVLRKKYEATRVTIHEEIKHVATRKRQVIKDIWHYKQELADSLDELAKQSVVMVNERYKAITRRMQSVVDKIDQYLDEIHTTLSQTETESETRPKVRRKTVRSFQNDLGNMLSNIDKFEGISICLDKGIQTFLDNKTRLAEVNIPCHTKLAGNIDITFDGDSETCGISDMCTLPDGTVVLTDLSNDCLKRLDGSYSKKGCLQLDGGPLGVCATKPGEMAVALRERQSVQFVEYTETSMTLTKSFHTESSCNYICCMNEALFITCAGGDDDNEAGHIRRYSMTGDLLSLIDVDDFGHKMFTTPLHITVNTDKTKLFVTDMDHKVIILDKTGKKLNQYQHTFLGSTFGISALPNKTVLVSSVDSHVVQQFDETCRYIGTILNTTNGIENPVCIAYNASRQQVLVSMDDADNLLVFDI